VNHVKLTLLLCALFAWALLCAGCSVTEVTTPSGWTYRSTRFFTNTGLDDASIDTATGAVSIRGARSDSSKALDVAAAALQRIP
jgi:hypothetical protein